MPVVEASDDGASNQRNVDDKPHSWTEMVGTIGHTSLGEAFDSTFKESSVWHHGAHLEVVRLQRNHHGGAWNCSVNRSHGCSGGVLLRTWIRNTKTHSQA